MIIRRDKKNKKTKNRKKPGKAFVFKRALFVFLLLIFCAVAFWTVFFSGVLEVHSVSFVPEVEVSTSDKVRQEIMDGLQGKYFDILPKNNLLVLRKKKLKKHLKEKFELVRAVSIKRKFPNELVVSLEEREIHIVWCASGECFLVDERGEAFLGFSQEQSGKIKAVDVSGKQVRVGDRVAEPELVFFLEEIPQTVKQEAGVVLVGELRTPSSMSDEVRVFTEEGWEIFFSSSRKIETQAQVLKKITQETIGKSRTKDLEYIDLRIKGKAIFKFKDQEEKTDE